MCIEVDTVSLKRKCLIMMLMVGEKIHVIFSVQFKSNQSIGMSRWLYENVFHHDSNDKHTTYE